MNVRSNHVLLTAALRSCSNRRVSWPPSRSLGRSTEKMANLRFGDVNESLRGKFSTAMKNLLFLLQLALALRVLGQDYYVAPGGGDGNPGSLEKPFATIQRAQQAVRQQPGAVWLRGGTEDQLLR